MPDQPYTALAQQSIKKEWIERVRLCVLHTAVNVFWKAAPLESEGPADTLARSVINDPATWAQRFAPVVAVILIGEPDLSEAQVADAELFSAVNAAWPRFFSQPALTPNP